MSEHEDKAADVSIDAVDVDGSTADGGSVDATGSASAADAMEAPGGERETSAAGGDGSGEGAGGDSAPEPAPEPIPEPEPAHEANAPRKSSAWKQFFHSWRGIVAAAVIVAAVAVPALWVEAVKPAMDKRKIEGMTGYSNAAIIPYKHSWSKVSLNKGKVDDLNVNPDQWLLKNSGDEWSRSSCFTFHAHGKTGKHLAKTTIAFGDPKSRDFFDSQASVFEDAMRAGKINLQVCMLLTDDEYSALAMETLGEVDYNDQSNTWQAIKNLLKVDVTEMKDGDARVDAALAAVKDIVGYDKKVDVRADSLKNGSFLQWSKVMTDAEKVEKIPAFWLDGKNLSDQEKFKLSNPDVMHERLDSLD